MFILDRNVPNKCGLTQQKRNMQLICKSIHTICSVFPCLGCEFVGVKMRTADMRINMQKAA